MSILREGDGERNLSALEITMASEVTVVLLLLSEAIIRAYNDIKETKECLTNAVIMPTIGPVEAADVPNARGRKIYRSAAVALPMHRPIRISSEGALLQGV